jgi:hypothetical protein
MWQMRKRGRLWVDPVFQSRLLGRIACHLVLWTFALFHFGFGFSFGFETLANLAGHGPARPIGAAYLEFLNQQKGLLIAVVLIAPVLLYDLLKFSHRIAGPLYRCRKVMEEMASGKPVAEFKPRKRDFMQDFFVSFNLLIHEWNNRAGGPTDGQAVKSAPSVAEKNGSTVANQATRQQP